MCLIPENSEIKIATKPIIVSKDLGRVESWLFGLIKFWYSPYYAINIRRKFGKVLIACEHLVIKKREYLKSSYDIIEEGFHAYRETIPHETTFFYPNAVIPVGAEYCLGRNNDIVANRIIVFKRKKDLDKYVSKCK